MEIASTELRHILDQAAANPACEVCGLLFGTAERIDRVETCANVADDPAIRFEIDPAALFAAHRAMRGGGPRLLGHYHSHPSGRAEPSAADAANACGDGSLWLIVAAGRARLWRTEQAGAFVAVDLVPSARRTSKEKLPYFVEDVVTTLTVTSKGQVTLRRDLLQHLGVRPGDKISIDKLPDGRIQVAAARGTGKISDLFGIFKRPGQRTLTIEEMNEIIADSWAGGRDPV